MAAATLSLAVAAAAAFGAMWAMGEFGFSWAADTLDQLTKDNLATNPTILSVELLLIGFTFWVPAVVGNLIHGRSLRSLLEPLHRFRWSIVGKTLSFQLIGLCLSFAVLMALEPQGPIAFNSFGPRTLMWLIPASFAVLIQTSGEDVFFKGFLLRQVGAATGIAWVAPTIVIAVFVSLHLGNPDVVHALWVVLPVFIASEAMIVYLTMRTGGMEVALVLHWANNFILMMLIAEQDTQANELTVFVFDDDPTTIADDVPGLVIYGLFIVAQLAVHTWERSPFVLPRHGWEQPDDAPRAMDESEAGGPRESEADEPSRT